MLRMTYETRTIFYALGPTTVVSSLRGVVDSLLDFCALIQCRFFFSKENAYGFESLKCHTFRKHRALAYCTDQICPHSISHGCLFDMQMLIFDMEISHLFAFAEDNALIKVVNNDGDEGIVNNGFLTICCPMVCYMQCQESSLYGIRQQDGLLS